MAGKETIEMIGQILIAGGLTNYPIQLIFLTTSNLRAYNSTRFNSWVRSKETTFLIRSASGSGGHAMARDYYVILGVSRGADQKKIQKAYRTIVKQFHPDASGTRESSERFLEIKRGLRDSCR
jgi:hypothetical protein